MIALKKTIIGALAGFLNGLFGSGGGALAVPAMQRFLKVDTHKAHATAVAIMLPLSVISLFVYAKKIEPNWLAIIALAISGSIGGFVGAKYLKKFSPNALRKIFGVFIIAAAIRMLFA